MTTSFEHWSSAHMHSLACVPKVRGEGNLPRDEPAHTPEISWKHSAERLIGDLLSAFILFSTKGISLLLPREDQGFKGLYMGAQIYINKHSSAAKVPFGAQNFNLEHDAPQARRNNHAHAGTGITQGTATQWSIF